MTFGTNSQSRYGLLENLGGTSIAIIVPQRRDTGESLVGRTPLLLGRPTLRLASSEYDFDAPLLCCRSFDMAALAFRSMITHQDQGSTISARTTTTWFTARATHGSNKRPLFVIPVAYLFAIMTTLGLGMGWQAYQVLKQWHKPHNYFSMEAANQLIDYYVWAFLALLIWQYMRFFSLQGPKWKRDLGAHAVIAMATAPIATLLYISVIALTRLGTQDMSVESRLKLNLRAEFIPNIIEYFTILAVLASVEYYRHYRRSEQETFHLQHALLESKLQALRAQLNPHFLFNAMNSVSCLLHRDPAGADKMLSRVANLLRITLARDDSREVGLLEEVELAEEYLEIQRIRFGSRLKLDIDIADEALEGRVPNMLLQPLVENACVHGVARTRGECRLEIKARSEGSELVITIYNDGPSVRPDWNTSSGIGLQNTIERLSLLYGAKARLDLANFQSGVRLSVRIPLQVEPKAVGIYETAVLSTPAHPGVM